MQFKHDPLYESASDASGTEPALRARHTNVSLPNVRHLSLVCDYASSSSSGSPTTSHPSNQPKPTQPNALTESIDVSYENMEFRRTPAKKRASSRMRRSTHTEAMNFEGVETPSYTTPMALAKADTVPTTFTDVNEHSIESFIKEVSKENPLNEEGHKKDKSPKNQADHATVPESSDNLDVQLDIDSDTLEATKKTLTHAIRPTYRHSFSLHAGPDDGALERITLCLGSVPGLEIRPTVSAYQLAAVATLSPKSYRRAMKRI